MEISTVTSRLSHFEDKCVLTIKNNQSTENQEANKIDVGICLDVSGSMGTRVVSKDQSWSSTKIKLCKEAIKFILGRLGNNRLGITTFDSRVRRILPLSEISDRQSTSQRIESIFPGSYTNLSKGLIDALSMMESTDESRIKYLLVFTDGCANEGIITKEGLTNLIQQGINKCRGIKIVIMGYGNDCNSTLLQELADNVGGSYHQLDCAEDIPIAMGEEFGTALQTCQQCISLKFDPAQITPIFKSDSQSLEGRVEVGDLLLTEERHFLFKLTDPDLINTSNIEVEYINCSDGKSYKSLTEGISSIENAVLVSETENIIITADAVQRASDFTGEDRRTIIKECLEKLTRSASIESVITKKLIQDLQEQLEMSDILRPECLRSYSSSARRQRGGDFASEPVAIMRGLSQGAVFDACSEDLNNFKGVPEDNPSIFHTQTPSLYPGALAPLPSTTLVRQTTGDL